MNIQGIFVNLPVEDINKTRTFWTNLGFSFNEKFSDERALCLILKKDHIHAMLVSKPMFSTFTNRPIATVDTTQVLLALEVESREKVDQTIQLALENGATKYRDSGDHGWMYYDAFADLDGHQWEVFFSDESLFPQS